MKRSFIHLRRGLLGIAFVGSLGFGATQAFAKPNAAPADAALACGSNERMCSCPGGIYCVNMQFRCPC